MPKSILLVEDEDSIAIALEFLMKREGHDLKRVDNGTDAIDSIRSEPPDLVLLDVMLPGCNGFQVCQSIRLDPALDRVKVLMMTAKGGGEIERRKGLALGANAFIAKPFALADLKAEMDRLLNAEAA